MLACAAESTHTDCVYDISPLVMKLPVSLPPVKQPGQACSEATWLWQVPRPSCEPLNLSKDAPAEEPWRTTDQVSMFLTPEAESLIMVAISFNTSL